MRLGGAYPFGQPEVAVPLGSGGVYYMPPGNYLVSLGQVTVLQYFDPTNLLWRNLGSPNTLVYVYAADGYNYRLVNMSGVVSGAKITNAGSGATVNGIGSSVNGVTVGFGAAPANGVAAGAYAIVGGQVPASITIVQGGSGFTVPPLILIDPPPLGGIQATAKCTISAAGVINAVTVTNQGAGYASVPNVWVIPQPAQYLGAGPPVNIPAPTTIIPPGLVANVVGSQAFPPFLPNVQFAASRPATSGALLNFGVGAVLAGSGTLTGLVVENYGANYLGTGIPTITFTGGGLAGGVAATAIMSLSLTSLTITNGGAAYATTPVWQSSYGFIAQTDGNNGNYMPRAARGFSGTSGGVINANTIEDVGFGIQSVPSIAVMQSGGTPATTVATLTAVMGGFNDVSLIQQAVQ